MEPSNDISARSKGSAIPLIPGKPVLDYASPGARSPLRLTNVSVIRVKEVADGTEIVETLTGRGQAIGAIAFTTFTVTVLSLDIFTHSEVHWTDFFLTPGLIYVLFVLGVAALIVAVIKTNWRQTILHVSHEAMTLKFKSPLRQQIWRWAAVEIEGVGVVEELDQKEEERVCELRIELSGRAAVNLFGGHEPRELVAMAEVIQRHLPGR